MRACHPNISKAGSGGGSGGDDNHEGPGAAQGTSRQQKTDFYTIDTPIISTVRSMPWAPLGCSNWDRQGWRWFAFSTVRLMDAPAPGAFLGQCRPRGQSFSEESRTKSILSRSCAFPATPLFIKHTHTRTQMHRNPVLPLVLLRMAFEEPNLRGANDYDEAAGDDVSAIPAEVRTFSFC